jgi:hypothetical protein
MCTKRPPPHSPLFKYPPGRSSLFPTTTARPGPVIRLLTATPHHHQNPDSDLSDQAKKMSKEVILSLWSAVHGFFTPAVLFILLNVVIGTIAVTSKASPPAVATNGEDAAPASAVGGSNQQQQRRLSRVPSTAFERIRSFNLSRFTAPAPEPAPVTEAVDLGYQQTPFPPAVEKEEPEAAAEPEREQQHAPAHVKRRRPAHVKSMPKAAAELEAPRLPARLHKSASEKSSFSHFEAQEVEEAVQAVEKRRPATTRDGGAARRLPVQAEAESKEEQEAGGEVDAQAENFINKFHHQLKLQRMESILRHRETVRRQAAGRRLRDSNKE